MNKKPEKKNPKNKKVFDEIPTIIGYNQAIDEYEKFLPSEKELRDIIKNPPMKYPIFQERKQPVKVPIWTCHQPKALAEAILKRLGKI